MPRGGKREGAGRLPRPGGQLEKLTVRVTPGAIERFQALQDGRSNTPAEQFDEMLDLAESTADAEEKA
jgi:hypothetical protein